MAEPDIVVAGAGPAGAVTALLMARKGYRVVLLDRARFPRHKSCAEYMSPGVVTALERLDLHAAIGALNPMPVAGMDIVSPRNHVFSVEYGNGPQRLSAWTLPRRVFDAALVTQARAAGVEVREGFVAREVVQSDGVVRGVTGSWNKETVQVLAPLTIVADGSRSVLRRDLGLTRAPRWPIRLGLVAHYQGTAALNGGRGQMHVSPGGYCGVAPLPDGGLNVAVVTRGDALRASSKSPTEFYESWVNDRPGLHDLLRSCERVTPVRGVGPIGSRSTRSWMPGCLLVGDAAAFFDPFTGEGMFRALRSAELAAAVADAALRAGTVGQQSLASYQSLRRSAFRDKSLVTALVQLFVQYPRLMEYALPRLSSRPDPAEALNLVLGDVQHARAFLNPSTLWASLRP